MTYKMQRQQSSFERGDAGLGKIRFSSDGKKVQCVIQVKTGKDQFEEKTYVLDRDDCPESIEVAHANKGSTWMLQMSSQGDKLMSFRPSTGAFVGVTKSFASKEGEEPAPKSHDVDFVREGKHIKYSYEYFTVIIKILEPTKFKDLEVPLILRYQFAGFLSEDGKKQVAGYSMTGKYTDALDEYLKVSGVLEDKYQPMDYKDNLLPLMQKLALHEERKFNFTMKDGWIVPGSLIPFDELTEELPFDNDDIAVPEDADREKPNPAKLAFEDDDEEMDFEPTETEFEE